MDKSFFQNLSNRLPAAWFKYSSSRGCYDFTVSTDGGSGPSDCSACACVIRGSNSKLKLAAYIGSTSSSQAELAASILAFSAIRTLSRSSRFRKQKVLFRSDSKVLISGLASGITTWKRSSWLNSNGRKLKDVNFWKSLDYVSEPFQVATEYVAGHTGDRDQEAAHRACCWSKAKGALFAEDQGDGLVGRHKDLFPEHAWVHIDGRSFFQSLKKDCDTEQNTRPFIARIETILENRAGIL